MPVNSTKSQDHPLNGGAPAPRPEQTSTAQTSTAPTGTAQTGTAPAGTAPAGTAPAGTAPAGPEQATPDPAWRHQRDLPVAGTRPPRSAPAADVVLAYLRLQAHELRALEPAVRADEYDAVHQMRVATRRLRATLRSFGKVIPRAGSAHLAAELKWLGQLLGTARDDEVLPAHLRDSLRPIPAELVIGPVHARVQGHFAPRRAAGHAEVTGALDSPRYAALLAELDQLTAGPLDGPKAGAPARDVLPKAVGKAYRQANRRMRRARHTPPGHARDVALHQARKSARRARYAAEAASPSSGKAARRFAKQMKKVQSALGEHQDAVLARRSARDLGIGAHLAGENAFTYGLLHEHERHHAARLQSAARKTWKKATRPRHLTWLS
jgi:CHAD domain-containing protein